MGPVKVFAALPTYDGSRHNGLSLLDLVTSRVPCYAQEASASALTYNFNKLWCGALNMRPEVTHFLMLHSDVVPMGPFVREMVEEMERVKADVLSVVIPIKSDQGVTSTALEGVDRQHPRRLMMREVFELEETFTMPGLLVNTGLMLVDMRKGWVEGAYFTNVDRIVRGGDGEWRAQFEPEDWTFSRMARKAGASVWATRKVPLLHMGGADFGNDLPWGDEGPDPGGSAKSLVLG